MNTTVEPKESQQMALLNSGEGEMESRGSATKSLDASGILGRKLDELIRTLGQRESKLTEAVQTLGTLGEEVRSMRLQLQRQESEILKDQGMLRNKQNQDATRKQTAHAFKTSEAYKRRGPGQPPSRGEMSNSRPPLRRLSVRLVDCGCSLGPNGTLSVLRGDGRDFHDPESRRHILNVGPAEDQGDGGSTSGEPAQDSLICSLESLAGHRKSHPGEPGPRNTTAAPSPSPSWATSGSHRGAMKLHLRTHGDEEVPRRQEALHAGRREDRAAPSQAPTA
ncbi:uncharacterized protein LOC114785835 isoform X2 [Denticeps clupeoides]|uniref:uncharacterized protein LOC114785835 isoform X2 n=1 Tax=Denticeps clupeoides TaxID=299321 RepID=UPI0010A58D6E|nr:uncharacterized protein LOC114785835 isoform X2 [Denticeps clupeoides]